MAPCSRTCSRAHLGWFIFQAGTSKPGSVVSRDGLITGAGLIGTLAGEACNKLPGVEGGSDGKGAEHRWVQGARPKGSQDAATVSLPLWCGDGELWGADPPPLTRARGGHAVVTVPIVPRPVLTLLSVTQKHRSQRHPTRTRGDSSDQPHPQPDPAPGWPWSCTGPRAAHPPQAEEEVSPWGPAAVTGTKTLP